MSFQTVNNNWEGLAQQDAMWAILTNPDKTGNTWDHADFFASGRNEIRVVFEYLKSNDLLLFDNYKALDFGCGVGRLTRALGDYFNVVEGIDVSPTMIEKAEALNKDKAGRLFFFVNENTRTNYEDNTFSFIYTTIVLQHIPYQQQIEYIKEFTRILKPGGFLVFQIPTKDIGIRKTSIIQKIKGRLNLRKLLSKIGVGKIYSMQMNPVGETEIIRTLEEGSCEVLAHLFTNHTNADFGGNLKFIKPEESVDYESSMFIARKK